MYYVVYISFQLTYFKVHNGGNMPIVISLNELPSYTVKPRDLARAENTLIKQGQIEPVVLDRAMNVGFNWYDAAIIEAARNLCWDTVLVTWPGEGRPNG